MARDSIPTRRALTPARADQPPFSSRRPQGERSPSTSEPGAGTRSRLEPKFRSGSAGRLRADGTRMTGTERAPDASTACWWSTTTKSCARAWWRCSAGGPNFQVVAEAGTAAESIEMARRYQPDLVVMDVRLPDGSGIEACREIRAEDAGHARSHADQLSGRGSGVLGHRRRRQRLPAQAGPRHATWWPRSRPSAGANHCSTQR